MNAMKQVFDVATACERHGHFPEAFYVTHRMWLNICDEATPKPNPTQPLKLMAPAEMEREAEKRRSHWPEPNGTLLGRPVYVLPNMPEIWTHADEVPSVYRLGLDAETVRP